MIEKLVLGFLLGLLPLHEPRYLPIYFVKVLHYPIWLALLFSAIDCVILALLLTAIISRLDRLISRLASSGRGGLKKLARVYLDYKRGLLSRHGRRLELYGPLALLAFVALPVPLTGMWSGAILSLALDLNPRGRFLVLLAGGLLSTLLVAATLALA